MAWVWLGCSIAGFACATGHRPPTWRKRIGGALAGGGAVAFTATLILWVTARLLEA